MARSVELGFSHFSICRALDKALEFIVQIMESNINGSVCTALAITGAQ